MVNRIREQRWPAIVLLGLLATGCASMDEDECRVADWRAIGYEDGASGRAASQLGERREACADHGVTPNFVAYRQGREEGLREYCTPAMGYRLGRKLWSQTLGLWLATLFAIGFLGQVYAGIARPYALAQFAVLLCDSGLGFFEIRQYSRRTLIESLARVRQVEGTRRPSQELHAESFFQPGNPPTDSRLVRTEAGGSGGKTARLDDGIEGDEIFKPVHIVEYIATK